MGSLDRPPADQADSGDLDRLLSAVAAGERNALKTLYRRTSARLFGIVLRVLDDRGAAEEVVQDVYLTIWNKASLFEARKGSALSWLAIIARNRAIDRKRKSKLPVAPIEAAAQVPSDDPLPSDVAERHEDYRRLSTCLGELDDRGRALIEDAFIKGATYRELATRDAVPLGTMKSLIRRGLLRLRKCMGS